MIAFHFVNNHLVPPTVTRVRDPLTDPATGRTTATLEVFRPGQPVESSTIPFEPEEGRDLRIRTPRMAGQGVSKKQFAKWAADLGIEIP
jgi:hypothetical protein